MNHVAITHLTNLEKSTGSRGPKANEASRRHKSYRPISPRRVPYKIIKMSNYTRVEPAIDPQLPGEQAGYRYARSTVDQAVLFTQNIEDS